MLVWDLDARDPSATARALDHERPVFALEVAADGAIVTASGPALRRWDLDALADGATVLRHGHAIVDFALTEGGRGALVAFEDRSVRRWDLAASVSGAGAEHLHHREALVDVAIDAEGERVLTASADEAILWRSGEEGLELLRRLGGHQSPIRAVDVAADGGWAATVDGDGRLLLWPLGEEREAAPRSYVSVDAPRHLAFAGRHLVVASDRSACVITPSDVDERRCRELTIAGELDSLFAAAAAPRIALAGYERSVILLDLDAHARGGVANTVLKTDTPMSMVALSGEGRWLAAASESGALRIARADEGVFRELQSPGRRLVALALASRGRWLAAADERAVHLYRLDGGSTAPRRSLPVDATVTNLAFAGDTLLATTTDGLVRRWSLTGDDEATLIGRQRGVIRRLRVAAGGEIALTAGDASVAHIWPLSPGRLLAQARRVLGPRDSE